MTFVTPPPPLESAIGVDPAGVHFCTLYPNGDFKFFTDTFFAWAREGAAEWRNHSFFAFVPLAHQADLRKAIEKTTRGESVTVKDWTCRLPNGHALPLDFTFIPRMIQAALSEILVFAKRNDSLPKEEATRTLNQSAKGGQLEFLEQALAHSPVGFGFFSRALRFSCVNDAYASLNGYAADQHLGHTLTELLPEVGKTVEPLVKRVIDSGESVTDIEVPITLAGEHHYTVQSFYPIRSAQGELLGVATVAADVSKAKHSEERLRRTARELYRSNEDLQRFAYIASHDLQEPLRMVANYIGLLESKQKGSLDDQAKLYMSFIQDGASRMRTLIMDLLEYAELSSGTRAACHVSTDRIFRDTLKDFESTIQQTHATIEVGKLPVVFCDPVQLGQVFQNLLGNALKYRGPLPPHIRVDAVHEGDHWVFSVQDNGIGIEMCYADHIFEPFRKLHSRAEYSGTGIGLAICRRIVESHRGKIWVHSEPGKGATFCFTLPDHK